MCDGVRGHKERCPSRGGGVVDVQRLASLGQISPDTLCGARGRTRDDDTGDEEKKIVVVVAVDASPDGSSHNRLFVVSSHARS